MELNEIENIVQNLEKSLAYTLTLGDKELFHSNVLSWYLKNHTDKGTEPLVKLFVPDGYEIEKVEREVKLDKNNQPDLYLTCHQIGNEKIKHFVLIENKFKSLPDKVQLERYKDKVAEKGKTYNVTTFILLAPQTSIDAFKPSIPQSWKTISYEDLTEALSDVKFSCSSVELGFKNDFTTAYKNLLNSLLYIIKSTVSVATAEDTPYYPSEEVVAQLKKIRFHDVYQKLYTSIVCHTIGIKAGIDWKTKIGYNHGPVMKWAYIPKGIKIAYGVEVQPNKFMVFAESHDKTTLTISENELKTHFEALLRLSFEANEINFKKDGKLYKYKDTYKYQYAKLPRKTSIAQLRVKIQKVINAIEGTKQELSYYENRNKKITK